MQFTKENADKVMAGTKTQTRRLVKSNDDGWIYDLALDGSVSSYSAVIRDAGWLWSANAPKRIRKWVIGRIYSVQPGRGKPTIGRIRLLSIRKEKLQDISEEDALAELGYGLSYNPNDEFPIRDFSYLWDSINPKGKRWADNPDVWALTFEVVK